MRGSSATPVLRTVLGMTLGAALATCLTTDAASGQISPGKLAAPHAELDGSLNCFQCHRVGHGVDAALCLNCHTPLRQRMRQSQGFHVGEGFMQCETCHIEHHGPEFELVWWGDGGMESFDHDDAGYGLEGAHGELGCRECHQSERVLNPQPLLDAGKDLDRTFLGLSTVCADCHEDTHRGQFEAATCETCHGNDSFAPAPHFDHDAGAFPLTGSHVEAECAACHVPEPDGFVPYRGVPTSCSECHDDIHRGRFGNDCASCHQTDSWDNVKTDTFDHGRTGFELSGAHRRATCESCHGPGLERLDIVGFETCATCHADVHLGQFDAEPPDLSIGRAVVTDCAACHGEDTFRPSIFDLQDHEETRFPLRGSHRDLGCESCHPKISVTALRRDAEIAGLPLAPSHRIFAGPAHPTTLPTPSASQQVQTFRLAVPPTEPIACVDCHRDPHHLAASELDPRACSTCHEQGSWTEPARGAGAFDHGDTGWPLVGGHAELRCIDCHRPETGLEERRIPFTTTTASCASCHQDPHGGQFDDPALGPGSADCSDCHGFTSWEAERFDHDRAAFKLEGGHRNVACVACHPLEEVPASPQDPTAEPTFRVRYKPLAHACSDCHGDAG